MCIRDRYKGNAAEQALFASVGKDTQLQVMKAFTTCADIKINLVIDHVVRVSALFINFSPVLLHASSLCSRLLSFPPALCGEWRSSEAFPGA